VNLFIRFINWYGTSLSEIDRIKLGLEGKPDFLSGSMLIKEGSSKLAAAENELIVD
jgi:hypothetical protein